MKQVWLTLKQYYGTDMDIIQEILMKFKSLSNQGIELILEHIKGHQDRSSNENLSYKAHLNIEADRLATAGLYMEEKTYSRLPSNKAMLFIDDKPVTSHHRQEMREAYHAIQLKEYFWDKYRWSDLDVKDIWWSINGKAMSSFTLDQQTTLNKYIHRRLPCNQRENLYYSYIEAICYNCKNDIETQDHIFQCKIGDERNCITKKYLRELNILLINNDTNDDVRRIINDCVYAWLNNQQIRRLEDIVDNPSEELQYTYNTQTYLGWNHFARGRLTKRWKSIFRATQNISNNTHVVHPEKWGKDILVLTWKFILEMWTCRNKIEHSTEDKKAATARKRLKLIVKIQWLHKKYKGQITEYGENITDDMLEKLPLVNLMMMEAQLSSRKLKKYDIDLLHGDQGDSQT
jgi:hypothetical protein